MNSIEGMTSVCSSFRSRSSTPPMPPNARTQDVGLLAKQVLESHPAVHAAPALNPSAREKFALRAIDLIDTYKLPFPKGFFRMLSKLDLTGAQRLASNEDYRVEIIESLLERAIEPAMTSSSKAEEIVKNVKAIASKMKFSDGALTNIFAIYDKLTESNSFDDVISFTHTLSGDKHCIDTFASALAGAGYPKEAIRVLLLHVKPSQQPALNELGERLIRMGQKQNATRLFQEAFRSESFYSDDAHKEHRMSLFIKGGSLSVAETLAKEIASPSQRAMVLIDMSDAFFGKNCPEDAQRVLQLAMRALTDSKDMRDIATAIIARLPQALPLEGLEIFHRSVLKIYSKTADEIEQVNAYKESAKLKREADNYARKGKLTKACESIAKISIVSYQIEAYASLLEIYASNIQRVAASIETSVKKMTDQRVARMRLASVYAKLGFRKKAEEFLSLMPPISSNDRITGEIESAIVNLAEAGLYKQAYRIALTLARMDACRILWKVAHECVKKDPKTSLEIFEHAERVGQMIPDFSARELLIKIATDKVIAGFCGEVKEASLFVAIPTLVDKAIKLANIDLEAAEEAFEHVIGITRKHTTIGIDSEHNPGFMEAIVEALTHIGLNQNELIEKTPETYPLVSAHYAMEVFKAENDHYRLAHLALRQRKYDPAIAKATCDKYRKV